MLGQQRKGKQCMARNGTNLGVTGASQVSAVTHKLKVCQLAQLEVASLPRIKTVSSGLWGECPTTCYRRAFVKGKVMESAVI